MMSKRPYFVISITLLLVASPVFGQEGEKHTRFIWLARDLLSSNVNTAREGQFGRSGSILFGFVYPSISGEEFLENEKILEELSVTTDQKNELKAVSAKFASMASMRQGFDGKKMPKTIEEARLEYWRSVDQILLKNQQKSLAQLQFRHLFRSVGLRPFFLGSSQVKEFLGVEKNVCEQIIKNGKENRKYCRELSVNSRLECVAQLFRQFDDEQRQTIFAKYPYLVARDFGFTERFRIHLQLDVEPDYLTKEESVLLKNAKFPTFRIGSGGELTASQPNYKNYDEKTVIHIKLLMLLEPSTTSSELAQISEEAELTEEQIRLLNVAREEFNERTMTIMKGGQASAEEWSKQMETNQLRLQEKFIGILSRQQIQHLNQYYSQSAATSLEAKTGPVFDILHGKLGDEFDMSDREKERFRKTVKIVTQKIERATIEIESKLLERIFVHLDPDQKSRLDELLGPTPEEIAVGLSVYEDK